MKKLFLLISITLIFFGCKKEEEENPVIPDGTPIENIGGVIRYDDAIVTGHLVNGDINGDGNQDLVFSVRTTPDFPTGGNQYFSRILFGDGAGAFNNPFDVVGIGNVAPNWRGPAYICEDFNNDGIDDFVHRGSAGVDIIEGYAGNVNGEPTALFAIEEFAAPIRAFDADNDGLKDIIGLTFGGSNQNIYGLLKNTGSDFSSITSIGNTNDFEVQTLVYGGMMNFTVANFNTNDNDDLLGVTTTIDGNNETRLALALFSGNGDGTFEYPSLINLLPIDLHIGSFIFDIHSKEIAVGDFDEDGDADIVITSANTVAITFLNDGNGSFTESQTIAVGNYPIHVKVADFNQDTHLDFVTVNKDSRNLTIAYGSGNGEFPTTETVQLDVLVGLHDIIVANFDGNSFPDIAVAENKNLGSVQMVLNIGE